MTTFCTALKTGNEQEALRQIEKRGYGKELIQDKDCHTLFRYGIGCYKKQCRVMIEK